MLLYNFVSLKNYFSLSVVKACERKPTALFSPMQTMEKWARKIAIDSICIFSLECRKQLFAPPFTDTIWIYFLMIHVLGGTELPRSVEVFVSSFLFWFWTKSCWLQLSWAVQGTRTQLHGWWAHVSYWRFKQWQHHSSRCAAFMLHWILLQ